MEFCESLGVTALNIGLVSDIGRARRNSLVDGISTEDDPFLGCVYGQLRGLAGRSTNLHILLPFRVRDDETGLQPEKHCICDGDNSQILYITADGTMMPCDKLPASIFAYGNVRKHSLVDTWVSQHMRTFKLKSPHDLPKCKDCPHLEICGGACVARAFHTSGSLESADWTSCIMAQKYSRDRKRDAGVQRA